LLLDILAELLRQEKEAHIMPDSDIDAFYEGKEFDRPKQINKIWWLIH
jgi:hypothetical protein